MGATNGLEVLFGLGGGTLSHMKAVANSVKPGQIEAMGQVFAQGQNVSSQSHAQLETAVDRVVTGWKGQAADAASTSVIGSALSSKESTYSSQAAHSTVVNYANQVAQYQAKINAIPEVDTSLHAAVAQSGGPAVAILNPGAVSANMAAAQTKALQHREQAAGHLNDMDDASKTMAASMKSTYTPIKAPPTTNIDNLPKTLQVQSPSSGGTGPGTSVPPPPPGGPGGTWTAPSGGSGSGPTVGPITDPTGTSSPPGTKNPGSGSTGLVGVPGDSGTTVTSITSPPGSTGGTSTVGLPDPSAGGGSGAGAGGLGGAAGIGVAGGALAGAGALAGVGSGGAGSTGARGSGNLASADDEQRLRAGARSGMSGAMDEDGSVLRGRGAASDLARSGAGTRGFGGAAEDMPLRGNSASELSRSGLGGRGFGGGAGGMGDDVPLRPSGLGGGSAGELAAGQRGGTMPGGGAGGRRDDEDELNKRPDYLVETDDIWGDGRLAAPPVLG